MKHLKNPLRISILGCLVNGFGEAKEADLGIAAGAGKGIIFKRGVPIRHVKEAEMVQALLEEVERFARGDARRSSRTRKRRSRAAGPGLSERPGYERFRATSTRNPGSSGSIVSSCRSVRTSKGRPGRCMATVRNGVDPVSAGPPLPVASTSGILALNSGQRLNGMGPADRLCAHFTKTEMLHLALPN